MELECIYNHISNHDWEKTLTVAKDPDASFRPEPLVKRNGLTCTPPDLKRGSGAAWSKTEFSLDILELWRYNVRVRMNKFGIDRATWGPSKKWNVFRAAQIWILLVSEMILQRTYAIFNYVLLTWYHYVLPFWGALCASILALPFWERYSLAE